MNYSWKVSKVIFIFLVRCNASVLRFFIVYRVPFYSILHWIGVVHFSLPLHSFITLSLWRSLCQNVILILMWPASQRSQISATSEKSKIRVNANKNPDTYQRLYRTHNAFRDYFFLTLHISFNATVWEFIWFEVYYCLVKHSYFLAKEACDILF